jgi:hypothetical protein
MLEGAIVKERLKELEIAERERDELRAELEKVRSEPMVAEFTLSVTQRAFGVDG